MSRVVSPVAGKPYGLAAVCRVWRFARSGVYRHQAPLTDTPPRRRGPIGAMSDEALTAAIRAVLAASPFHGEGHRKVWATASRGHADVVTTGAATDARARPAGAGACWLAAWAARS
jgi:hypothetical protein